VIGQDANAPPSLLDGSPDPAIIFGESYEILAANQEYRREFGNGGRVERL
jgi:hypothetical protein